MTKNQTTILTNQYDGGQLGSATFLVNGQQAEGSVSLIALVSGMDTNDIAVMISDINTELMMMRKYQINNLQ